MKMTMTAPCKRCPFRNDIRPYIREGRAREIASGLTGGNATFTCHETTVAVERGDGESEMVNGPNAQHCAGALIMLEHMAQPTQLMRIYERTSGYDASKLNMAAPVYRSARAFIAAHRRRQRESSTSHSAGVRSRRR